VGWKRHVVLRCGSVLPTGLLNAATAVASTLELGRWLRDSKLQCRSYARSREELFDGIAAQVGSRPALYLEFGVWEGESMRIWSRLLTNPNSVLHGFDSFEGLPVDWEPGFPRGAFDTQGRVPVIDDPRVRFSKGWFRETLRTYTPPEREVMIVNVDADLYSSAHEILTALEPHFRAGDFLYFDEFCVPQDEARAFRELLARSGLRFELLGATRGYRCVAFRCCGGPR